MKVKKIMMGILSFVLLTGSLTGCVTTTSTSSRIDVKKVEETTGEKEIREDNEQFSLAVSYGLNGMIVGNSWFPVNLKLQNKGKDFIGTARVILPSSNVNKNIAYEKEFSIAENAEKSVAITIPGIGNFEKFRVEIADENNKIVFFKEIRTGLTEQRSQNEIMVGILSDDDSAISYFNNQFLELAEFPYVKTVELDETTLPSDVDALATLTYLIINQYTTEKLNEEQIQAIIAWVNQGGNLILGTGASVTKVLNGFPKDYLNGTIGETIESNLTLVSDKAKTKAKVSKTNLEVPKSEKITDFIKGGNIYRLKKENGAVIITDFDLGSYGIGIWENRDQFATQFLEKILTDSAKANIKEQHLDNNYIHNMISSLDFYRDIKIPKPSYYMVLFMIYILIIGPIGYFLLKRFDKREFLWVLIPVVALTFNGIIFCISTASRIHNPVVTAITMIDSSNKTWKDKVYLSFLNPTGKAYSVKFQEQCQKLVPLQDRSYYTDNKNLLDTYRYAVQNKKDGISVRFGNEKAFESNKLMLERIETKELAGFEKNLNLNMDHLSGTVTNHTGYDLTEVRLVYNGMYVAIGDMKDGETKRVESTEVENLSQTYVYDIADQLVNTMARSTTEERVKYNQIYNMYTFFAGELENMETGEGYLFGIVEQYDQDYIENAEIKESGKALIYDSFKEMPKDAGKYYVHNITLEARVENTGDITDDGNMLYSESAEVLYEFPEEITIQKVFANKTTENIGEHGVKLEGVGRVFAWNYRTEQYEPVFEKTQLFTKEEKKNYIKDNQMKLKFESQSGNWEIPRISVTGG